ncbi:hypothetical protein NC796_01430 [Aliifodinibius sp. S!AR15-10]|uniref:hypothetical protein n=1 Tax=Aliifodinibius sp. S!AR15-10 TaxID=2950437 RepID=UPI002854C5C4|nr:hypothetical protein [Aliifodinibius sp. S!AR15-10]MDR8389778.1 hypothetical protein [Aliifodinibius sp. S!AR15-10]
MPEIAALHSNARKEAVDHLSRKVRQSMEVPTDVYAVAVELESMGVNDKRARKEYRFNSIFDLAEEVYEQIKQELDEELSEDKTKQQQKLTSGSVWERILAFVRYYGAGLLFMAPMFSQILSVVFITYSLWAWLYFNELQATVIAIGTIVAFVATGGITLTAGREISYYFRGQENYYLSYKVSRNIFGIGLLVLLAVGMLIYLVNLVIPFYPHNMMVLSGIYMLFIGIWLLSSTILYALQKHFMILMAVLAGTGVVILGMEYLDMGIYYSHWFGIFISSLVMLIYSFSFLKYQIYKNEADTKKQHLPKFEVKYYNNYRYFIYGTCYFLFLFLDRIMAWSTGTPPPPYIIWFNTSYELGMDWALISLVLITASLEYSVNRFSTLILPIQKKTNLTFNKKFHDFFKDFYIRQLFLLSMVGLLSIIGNYYLVNSFRGMSSEIQIVEDFFSSAVLYKVFWLASFGYLFTSVGLMNTLFFFTLGRPEPVVRAMTIAILVNIVVGFVCSRWYSFEYAVVGLVAGGLTFAVITAVYARRFFGDLHYYYYSAY